MDGATSLSSRSNPEQDAVLAYWKKRIAELPDIRFDKVCRTRTLLERNSYDTDEVLETTIDRVVDDLGVLCRQAS